MRMRPIMKIHGGKYYLSEFIINHFPNNYAEMTYVELFGGAASVLTNKNRSIREIYNDLHAPTANIFLNLVKRPDEFIELISELEYKEESFQAAKLAGLVFQYDYLPSAVSELVLRRMSRGGMKQHFSWSERLRGGRPGDLNAWETFKSLLPKIAERMKGVEILNDSAASLVPKYNDSNTLIYLDPPYVKTTRTSKSVYDCEMTDEEHRQLATAVLASTAKIIVSGYDCPLYKELYKGWRVVKKEVPNNSGQGKKKQRRVECIWLNY